MGLMDTKDGNTKDGDFTMGLDRLKRIVDVVGNSQSAWDLQVQRNQAPLPGSGLRHPEGLWRGVGPPNRSPYCRLRATGQFVSRAFPELEPGGYRGRAVASFCCFLGERPAVDTDVGGVLPNVRRSHHRFCAREGASVAKTVRGGVGHRRSGEAGDTTLNEAASCLMVRINPRSRRTGCPPRNRQ